jgi:plasmid stabilization system protein ParE
VRIRITRRADAQIEEAAAWREEHRPLAADALHDELAEAFSLLLAQPAIGAPRR